MDRKPRPADTSARDEYLDMKEAMRRDEKAVKAQYKRAKRPGYARLMDTTYERFFGPVPGTEGGRNG